MNAAVNRAITLAARPDGLPRPNDFSLTAQALAEPADGQMLCRTVYLSLDPYMRGRMNAGKSYAAPVEIGQPMCGATVSEIVKSNREGYAPGDFVLNYGGWQEYSISDGQGVRKLDPTRAPVTTALGVLGMPGMTAYVGLLDIGRPASGETVVVAAATGPVGSAVGQMAKLRGCRVVGIAGSEEKCRYAVSEFGFDHCVNHRTDLETLKETLRDACPDGIDIYYENVGGAVLEAVISLLNQNARIPVCGLISHYNDTELPPGPNLLPKLMRVILTQRVMLQGFIVSDHGHRQREFLNDVGGWVASGEIRYREDLIEGLDNTIDAFQGLLQGRNFGKLMVRLAADSSR